MLSRSCGLAGALAGGIALFQHTAKLAQHADFIAFWANALTDSTLLCLTKLDGSKKGWPVFTHSTDLMTPGCLSLLQVAVQQSWYLKVSLLTVLQ